MTKTNAEIAKDILYISCDIEKCDESIIYEFEDLIDMAQYKDQQFKSLLESEIERMKVDYPDTATIQIRRYLEGLVEKLFKEE